MQRMPTVGELHRNVFPCHVLTRKDKNGRFNKFEIGERTTEHRSKILDEVEFFYINYHDTLDLEFREQKCKARLREMINLFVDYVQQNYLDDKAKGLPAFPDEFHKAVHDVVFECTYVFRLNVNVGNVYQAIHRCILAFAPKTEFRYVRIPEEYADDQKFWKTPLENERLRELSEKRFDKYWMSFDDR